MGNNKSRWADIAVSRQTKDSLDSVKHPGQSYDGIIRELIDLWKKVKEEEAVRLEQRS